MNLTRVSLLAYAVSAFFVQIAHSEIRNPTIFIGEVVTGGTAGAPLSQSSTNKIASGINSTEVTATSAVTTTSPTDVVMTTMTTTPVAGTYFVSFSTWCSHSTGNSTITISLYNNAVQKADSVRLLIPFVGALSAITQDMPVSINGIVTATGSGAVAIEWHTSSGTATCTQRTLDLVRLQ